MDAVTSYLVSQAESYCNLVVDTPSLRYFGYVFAQKNPHSVAGGQTAGSFLGEGPGCLTPPLHRDLRPPQTPHDRPPAMWLCRQGPRVTSGRSGQAKRFYKTHLCLKTWLNKDKQRPQDTSSNYWK